MKSLKINGFKFERIDISGNYFLSCGEQECKLTNSIQWLIQSQEIQHSRVESPDLPALTTQSFLDPVGLAGSHWLSMSFLLLPQPEIKTQRESSGWRLQLFTLHRTEKGYPPLFTHSQGAVWQSAKYTMISPVFLSSSFISLISSFKVTLSFRAVKDVS